MKQKFLTRWNGLSLAWRQLFAALFVTLLVMTLLSGVAMAARMRAAILCDGGEPNCVEAWNGANLIIYSDNGTTQKFKVTGSNGNLDIAGGQTNSNWLSVSAATAVASATPAARVNDLGAANDILSVEKASTPVFKIGNAGAVTGKVLQYNAASGQAQICSTTIITGTGVLAHGMATPSYVQVSLGADATGDGARVTFTNASKTVTAKVWNTALTPAAATTPVSVDWCVIGTP